MLTGLDSTRSVWCHACSTVLLLCWDGGSVESVSGSHRYSHLKWSIRTQAPALGTECSKTLTAELTQGPYYLDDILFRSDISEGQAGVPLTLHVYLKDTSCNPIEDAFISIWHANATGVYSGFTGDTCLQI